MEHKIFIGAQWGDEGKGRFIDYFTSLGSYLVVRYQGGPNAGHTVYADGNKYVLHQLPTGIIHQDCISVIGNGCVINPKSLFDEIEDLKSQGIEVTPDKLKISSNVHLITPYHIARDKILCEGKFGTTGRGIGPCYESKFTRSGFRLGDVNSNSLNKDFLTNLLVPSQAESSYVEDNLNIDEFFNYTNKLTDFICDTSEFIYGWISQDKEVIYEGAQGSDLDIDHGTYPYVSTSNSTIGGAFTGSGVYVDFKHRVGIFKAYVTRVGTGPFPTGDACEFSDMIQEKGEEFGATTGRVRKCGWLDLVQLKKAIRVNGFNSLIMTKLDVLSGLPYLGVCVGYENEEPKIELFESWEEDITSTRDWDSLPTNAKKYISCIRDYLSTPIDIVSVGKKREDLIPLTNRLTS